MFHEFFRKKRMKPFLLIYIFLSSLASLKAQPAEDVYYIPVVVHVVHNGEPVGVGPNISLKQIQSQIEVLNEDFRRIRDTRGYNENPAGADTRIEFFLAAYDPEGKVLSEPGVDRVEGDRAVWPKGAVRNPIDRQLKPITIWDPERYFNIWTVNFGGFISRNLLGYTQFPDDSGLEGLDENEGTALTDGIVVGYKYFGSSEKGNFPELFAPYDLGRTTTHEVGHWLGLRHIWGDGDCTVDDFCEDTPNAAAPSTGCPEGAISCAAFDMYENYMDYSHDACMNIFTQCQKSRMRQVLETSPRRKSLVVSEKPTHDQKLTHAPTLSPRNTLTVYPNPFIDQITISWDPGNAPGKWIIYDILGHYTESGHISSQPSIHTYSISTSLSKGLYILEIYFQNNTRSYHHIQRF